MSRHEDAVTVDRIVNADKPQDDASVRRRIEEQTGELQAVVEEDLEAHRQRQQVVQ